MIARRPSNLIVLDKSQDFYLNIELKALNSVTLHISKISIGAAIVSQGLQ